MTLPYGALRTDSSSSSSNDNNDIELLSDVEMSSDLVLIETAAAADMPLAQVGHLKLAAIASSSCNNLGDDCDQELPSNLD